MWNCTQFAHCWSDPTTSTTGASSGPWASASSASSAALGGLMFIVIVVGTILAGPRLDVAGAKLHFPLHDRGREAVTKYGSEGTLKLPGTVILVGIFFACFVLYYFVNWKYLSEVWLLS